MSEIKRGGARPGAGRALQRKKRTEPAGKLTWREYTSAEWDKLCGVSPDLRHRETGRFVFNKNGVCINPHVLGLAARDWRIGIYTAKTPSGLWSHARDVSFNTAGWGAYPWRLSFDGKSSEDEARCAELHAIAAWVELNADQQKVSCPISGAHATAALSLIREKIDELSTPKLPIYTQLSLF